MHVPWNVLVGSGAISMSRVQVQVQVTGLEGQVDSIGGAELQCEARFGPMERTSGSVSKPNGPKLATTLLAGSPLPQGGATQSRYVALSLAPGAPGLLFDLGRLASAPSSEAPYCRVKLWEKKVFGGGFMGEASFPVPVPPHLESGEGRFPLGKGRTVYVSAGWKGLDRSTAVRLADFLGDRILATASAKRWSELQQLARSASTQGFTLLGHGEAVAEQCRALALGKANSEGWTALRACAEEAPGQASAENLKTAAKLLLEGRADVHTASGDGDSPLTAALRKNVSWASLLPQFVPPSVAEAVGLSTSAPWVTPPINWEVLRTSKAFSLTLFAAETLGAPVDDLPQTSARTAALRDALFYAVSHHFLEMSRRVLAAMPPLTGRASTADVLLMEQMLRLAGKGKDKRWFEVAEAQLHRGAAAGPEAWRGSQRIVQTLSQLAAQGQGAAHSLLLEVALGPDRNSKKEEPRVLFPEGASECAVCFEPLYQQTPAYFLDPRGHRRCPHYVCGSCAATVLPQAECPMCRAPVAECRVMPSIEADPAGWFAVASCGDGQLDRGELCHAVAACLPVSEERLMAAIEADDGPWKRAWERDGSGTISEEEFFAPGRGLYAWILEHLAELHWADENKRTAAPDLREDPAAWFDFWDTGRSGSLSYGQLLRGYFAASHVSALEDRKQLSGLRKKVTKLWRKAGLTADSVTKVDFLLPEGLGAVLAESLQSAGVPTGAVPIAALPPSPPLSPDACAASPASSQLTPLEILKAMGFNTALAERALQNADGDAERAIALLLRG